MTHSGLVSMYGPPRQLYAVRYGLEHLIERLSDGLWLACGRQAGKQLTIGRVPQGQIGPPPTTVHTAEVTSVVAMQGRM